MDAFAFYCLEIQKPFFVWVNQMISARTVCSDRRTSLLGWFMNDPQCLQQLIPLNNLLRCQRTGRVVSYLRRFWRAIFATQFVDSLNPTLRPSLTGGMSNRRTLNFASSLSFWLPPFTSHDSFVFTSSE